MKKFGIIGYGNMGKAIAERIKDKYAVCVYDKDSNKISGLTGIGIFKSASELVKQSEVVILAVKPQDFDSLLDEIKSFAQGKLFITIAASITTKYVKSRLGDKIRVVRVMPNMPAQIGQGISVLFKDKDASEGDLNLAWELAWQTFSYIGSELVVENEQMMDAATAISGSGPAFFCYHIKDKAQAAGKRDEFVRVLAEAAETLGFDARQAQVLSERTVDGIIAMLIERNLSCDDIIKMISSKGGTTEAGLEVLHNGGSLVDSVKAAVERAKQLSRG